MMLRPRPLDARRPGSIIDVTPTPAQRRAIDEPAGRAMLVLGDAGFGKTTLALLRLADLERRAERFRGLVVVPTEGLRALVEDALFRLGIGPGRARVRTYEQWILREARRAFVDLPRRTSEDATSGVMRLKRSPALEQAIGEIASRPPRPIDDDDDRPDVQSEAHARWADLQHLFGDRAVLEDVAARGLLPRHAVDETLAHTKVQFSARSEVAWSHVTDRAKLRTLDGARLDVGTPDADASTIDAEDGAVMFAIDRARAEHTGGHAMRPRRVDCLVLDEAQELAPIELAILGRSLRHGGTLIVAGDADQQIDPTMSFPGWPQAMEALGANEHEVVTLDHGFRCPPEVVAMARAARDGGVVEGERFESVAAIARFLDEELPAFREADPAATVAIICREERTLQALARAMSIAVPIAHEGRFPKRGPVFARVDQVRGLEFDVVVVPDLDRYDDTPASRRTLYVAMTRARHQLVTTRTS